MNTELQHGSSFITETEEAEMLLASGLGCLLFGVLMRKAGARSGRSGRWGAETDRRDNSIFGGFFILVGVVLLVTVAYIEVKQLLEML
jgi:threonine/homoserine/homoserine lactone efflux protein